VAVSSAGSSARPRLAFFCLVPVAALLAAWAILELAVRLLGLGPPWAYRFDPLLGSRGREGASFVWKRERRTAVQLNSRGFRERELPVPRPAGVSRVAVLGDSFVEAFQVEPEQMVTRRLERLLAERGGPAVQVLGFGCSSWGTAQQWLLLDEVLGYGPSAVVLLFTLANDVRNNSAELEPAGRRPFFKLENGELTYVPVGPPTWLERWMPALGRSQAARLLLERVSILRQGAFLASRARQPACDPAEEVFLTAPGKAWAAAWEVTARLLRRMRERLGPLGVRLVVVPVTPWQVVYPAVWQERLTHAPGCPPEAYDVSASESRLASLCAREGLEFLSPTAELIEASRRSEEPLYLARVGHWSPAGHAVVAASIARRLAEKR
jgi:hypothetical protein